MTLLADLYRLFEIPVLLYDQIGCGRSTHLREKYGDAEFWFFELLISELSNLIDHLKLRQRGFYLLGQSWGGVFAASYAMPRYHGGKSPEGLRKLIIHSGPASIPLYGMYAFLYLLFHLMTFRCYHDFKRAFPSGPGLQSPNSDCVLNH